MLSIGNAPCSWGIYYPKDNRYTPDQYLDQVRDAGYATTELGPLGFLPTDAAQLKDALAARGLALTGATHVHTLADPSTHDALLATMNQLGKLVSDAGSKHVVIMDEGNWYPPGKRGVVDEAGWKTVVGMVRDAQERLAGEYGIAMTFHPHLGTCVEREAQIDRLLQTQASEHGDVVRTQHRSRRGSVDEPPPHRLAASGRIAAEIAEVGSLLERHRPLGHSND